MPGRSPNSQTRNAWLDQIAVMIVIAAISMNGLLAVINNHVVGMNITVVTAVQLTITAAAIAAAVVRGPQLTWTFWSSCLLLFGLATLSALYHEAVDFKTVYDATVVPTFIALGATIHRFRLRAFMHIFYVILAVALLEALLPQVYAYIFNPLSYLSSTRDWIADEAATRSINDGLYIGANRSGGSVFSFIAGHRVGSIFLEPISLGLFALIFTFASALVHRTNPIRHGIIIFLCLLLSMMSDSRMATALIILSAIISYTSIRVSYAFIFSGPLLILLVAAIIHYTGASNDYGDLSYRLAMVFNSIDKASFADALLGGVIVEKSGDNGLGLLISSFGIIGAIIILYINCGILNSRWDHFTIVPVLGTMYFTTSLLFGGASFSIKTAAFFGFLLGAAGKSLPFDRISATRASSLLRAKRAL